jgi:hypothetical protein
MAGPAPKTRNWSAHENAHKPKGLHVTVTGQVEVTSTSKQPILTESAERDPKHLGLTLTIKDSGGPGDDVVCWKLARFHKEVKAIEYDTVVIRWDVSEIARTPVVDDRERAAHAAEAMKAVNAKHGKAPKRPGKPKPAAAEKAAPKKAAAKKASPKKAAPKKAKKAASKKKAKAAPKKAVAARVVRAVGGWAKGAKKALKRALAPKKKAKKAKKKKR